MKTEDKVINIQGRRSECSDLGTPARAQNNDSDTHQVLPSLAELTPNVLEFTAPCTQLSHFALSSVRQNLSSQEHVHTNSGAKVRAILDPRGKRCGLWWVPRYHSAPAFAIRFLGNVLLVGVNQNGNVFQRRTGPYRVEGEIEMFDDEVYPAIGEDSGLVNLLVVHPPNGQEHAERITVARVHIKAWREAGPQMERIQLA